MAVPILYGAPRLSTDLIRRDRLVRLLDERAPLTVVRGPGGCGKTVLVASSLHEAGVAGVWVSVDSSTSSRHALWSAVGRRLTSAGLAPPGSSLDLLGEMATTVSDLQPLLRTAMSALRVPVMLVLDDFHSLQEPDTVAEDLIDLLAACPQLSVTVTTRTPSSLEGSLAGAKLDRVVITPPSMALSLEETGQVLAAAGLTDPAEVTALHHASGGSVLLLRALLRGHGAGTITYESSRVVAQGLVSDLLRGMPEARRHFMMQTAIPEEFDLSLARALAGSENVEEQLDHLESQGVLMRSDRIDAPLYRYHPLLREALLIEGETQLGSELSRLHRIAARWCEAHDSPKAALGHAVAAHDLEFVSQILLAHGIGLLPQRDVYAMLSHLSAAAVARHPLIALMLAVGAYARRNRRFRAVEYFAVAIAASRVMGSRAGPAERAALATVESVAFRLTGRPAQGVSSARRALRLLRGDPVLLAPLRDQLAYLRSQNAVTLMRAGRTDEARAALRDNMADLESIPLSPALATVSLQAALQVFDGDMKSAAASVALVDEGRWPAAIRNDYPGATYHLAKAIQAMEDFDVEGARRHVEVLAPHMATLEYRPYFVAIEALADLAEGSPALGLQRLDRFTTGDVGRRHLAQLDQRLLGPVRALLHLAQGQVARADQVLKSLPAKSAVVMILRALRSHLTGDHERAISLLARTHTPETTPRIAALAHLLAAATALRADRPHLAVAPLEKMAAVMADCGLRSHLALVPRSDLLALRVLAEEKNLGLVTRCLDLEGVPEVLPEAVSDVSLTERERVVLHALVERSSQAEIAEYLVVSPNTVKSQLRSLYRKLEATGREEALAVAFASGLLERPGPAEHSPDL